VSEVEGNRDGRLHFNRFTIQKIRSVLIFTNRIESRLLQHSRTTDNLGMKNIPILINFNCYHYSTRNASCHSNGWLAILFFVDEHIFRDFRRNSDMVRRLQGCDGEQL